MPDKRTEFNFGANLSPLARVRGEGLTIRFHEGNIMVSPSESITPDLAGYIKENRESILKELDQEMREAAIGSLPFPDLEDQPVQLREAVLLKLEDGTYLAITPEEASQNGLGC